MFPDYSQFLEPQGEIIGYAKTNKQFQRPDHSGFMYHKAMNSQHDLVYSEFTEIITKRLIAQPYPKEFHNFNPFCPICLKFVQNSQNYTTCFIGNERNYLIHKECLKKDKAYQFRNIGQVLENSFVVQKTPNNLFRNDQGFDFRGFYIQINFLHPINQKSFLKINKKIAPNKNKFKITFNELEQNSFFPNIVLVPKTDFNITISIIEMDKKGNNAKITKYLSLKNVNEKNRCIIKNEEMIIEAEIIQNMAAKKKIISEMNYKYRYDLELNIPLIRIHAFHINLPESLLEDSSEEEEFIIDSNSNIVEELLKEKEESISTIRTSEASPTKNRNVHIDLNKSFQSTNENEKINLEKLIYTNTLIDYVKNNSQSRIFQGFLAQCEQSQIELIIFHIKPKIVELITHEYGNYMVQKLFKVCSPYQRIDLLQAILPSLSELVRNKQGTHTIQAFIENFTLNEEYTLVIMQIMNEYYELCRHNNSTHFIQKIIKTFPFQYTITFFHYTAENLLPFALDKNAMCVIKHMMRRLRELQGKEEGYDQAIEMIKRQMIINVTFNVDKLIMDSYGNYVIQFCYELFDLEKCAGITERILSRFFFYSVGKFSSNVLIKCISAYWVDKSVYKTLRGLNNSQIVEIFRNKDGNKVLLQIMERLQRHQLWDRLYSVLIQIEPARYYHDRWGVCLGSRSGQVGCKLQGFPDAKKKNYIKKS